MTVTVTRPLACVGRRAVQVVFERQRTRGAVRRPKRMIVRPRAVAKPLPLTVTRVPPRRGPCAGETAVTVGARRTASVRRRRSAGAF